MYGDRLILPVVSVAFVVFVDSMYCSSFFMGVNEEYIRGGHLDRQFSPTDCATMLWWHDEETAAIAVCLFWKEF